MADSKVPQRWVPDVLDITGPATPAAEEDSALRSLLRTVELVRRHWLLVLGITAASVGVLTYQMRKEPRIYRATATIRLEDKAREISNGMSSSPYAQTFRPFNDPVLSQLQVLQSQAVAESVAVREGLRLRELPRGLTPNWATAISVSPTAPPSDTIHVTFTDSGVAVRSMVGVARAGYGSPVTIAGIRFTVLEKPNIRSADLAVVSTQDAANEVRGSLSSQARERTDVVDVSYIAPDPYLAQRVANAAVRVFQDYSAQSAKQESVLRRQFISQQLAKTESLLADARDSYNAFRTREKVFSTQDKFRGQQADLAGIEIRRQELLADKATYTTLLDELQRTGGALTTERLSALAASPGIASNPVVSQMFGQLAAYQAARDSITSGRWGSSENNPDVQRLDALISSAQGKVVSAIRANVTVIDARVAALDQRKATVTAGIYGLPQAEATEATLQAQVNTYSRQVDRLRDELQSAEIAEAAEVGQVDIVDLARSSGVPIGTGRRPKIVLALVLGLLLGLGAAYVIENYRPVIRRRDELEQAIALPNLALVPQIRNTNGHSGRLLHAARMLQGRSRFPNGSLPSNGSIAPGELVTVTDGRSSGAEAYRTLRTNLLFSSVVSRLRRVVITSPGPAEGKSTTAANLAIAFAQQGHRVLLMDCDLRRSRIHKMFGEAQVPGLTNVLIGSTPLPEAIRATKIDGLRILPSGALPPNPAELLGSANMHALLQTVADSYDLVIIDTPPLLAASDAAIVSKIADGALVVVRAGKTERSALQAAMQQLATVGARVFGTVLNDPDAEVPKYAKYYSYYYNNYYEYPSGPTVEA